MGARVGCACRIGDFCVATACDGAVPVLTRNFKGPVQDRLARNPVFDEALPPCRLATLIPEQ